MSKHIVVEMSGRDRSRNELTELIPDGARKLINEALEAEANRERPEWVAFCLSPSYQPTGSYRVQSRRSTEFFGFRKLISSFRQKRSFNRVEKLYSDRQKTAKSSHSARPQ